MPKTAEAEDQRDQTTGTVIKFSLAIAGHRTSISLERPFWLRLNQLAALQGQTVPQLVAQIDAGRAEGSNLSSAIRVFLLQQAIAAASAGPG